MTTLIQSAWQWAQTQPSFTSIELATALAITRRQGQHLVQALRRHQAIKATNYRLPERFHRGGLALRYKAIHGAQPNLPGKGGNRLSHQRDKTGQQRIWQSIRILRRFGLRDLEATADVTYSTARSYVAVLVQHGYLRRLKPDVTIRASRGRPGCYTQYRLIRDTGPIAPQRNKTGLYDRNLDKDARHVELD